MVWAVKLTGLLLVIAGMWIGLDAAGRSFRVFAFYTWGHQWQATVSDKHPHDCPDGGAPCGRSITFALERGAGTARTHRFYERQRCGRRHPDTISVFTGGQYDRLQPGALTRLYSATTSFGCAGLAENRDSWWQDSLVQFTLGAALTLVGILLIARMRGR